MNYLIQVKEADGTWFRIASFSTRLTRDCSLLSLRQLFGSEFRKEDTE